MSLYFLVRPLLFCADAEAVHETTMALIATGIVSGRKFEAAALKKKVMGLEFRNPLGLAAGMDKNATAVHAWPDFGFGFVEIGTITRYAQPGNPKPRLWRFPAQQALINRMGFNGEGAEAVARHLAHVAERQGRVSAIPLGINIGKTKKTPLAEAPEDYAGSFSLLYEFGDYFVVNVSSPNTPGLRSLQESDSLRAILSRLQAQNVNGKPLLVKVAPDLSDEALLQVLAVALEMGLAGIVATNTTLSRTGMPSECPDGGLSGAPLRDRALEVCRLIAMNKPAKMALIAVGGIMTPQDAIDRLRAGADLIQTYTGFVYGGPDWPSEVVEAIAQAADQS